jgi:hypothetical protein
MAAKSKTSNVWKWRPDKNTVGGHDWLSKRGPITLMVWDDGDAPDVWLWSVDIYGTGPSAPDESLALYGPPAKTKETAMRRAEKRAERFILSLANLMNKGASGSRARTRPAAKK